ncbi:MAG: universal stress protein, partial [Bacteroidota bacterium]
FPIAVARGGADEAENVAEAERLMERAVLHATAASVPVTPTVRIDDNPVRGISRGAREVRASEIVAGWNGQRSPGALVFGHVIDGVLQESRAMAMVVRSAAPLAAAKRLVVLVPPLVYREPGFARAARALKVLAAQKGLRIRTLSTKADLPDVADRLRSARPEAPVESEVVEEWSQAVRQLDRVAETGDVIVLVGVRRGAVAWRPALQRLPRVLARRYPDLDLLSVTLSEAEVVPLVAEAVDSDGEDDLVLPAGHIVLGMEPMTPEDMLRELLRSGFPDHPGIANTLASRISANAYEAPEVMPGVVFYHAHVAEVDIAQVFVGVCPAGVPFPHTSQPAQVLLVLLAPTDLRSEDFLRQLAVTAQLVRSDATVDALLAAATPAEAREALLDAVRQELSASPTGRSDPASATVGGS